MDAKPAAEAASERNTRRTDDFMVVQLLYVSLLHETIMVCGMGCLHDFVRRASCSSKVYQYPINTFCRAYVIRFSQKKSVLCLSFSPSTFIKLPFLS
jgi:hypothetical protein